MDKEPCTKCCGIWISFHEVMNLQNFQFDVNEVIPANIQNIPLLGFFAYFY